MKKLIGHHKNPDSNIEILVNWDIKFEYIEFEFSVKNLTNFHTCDEYTDNFRENSGLWDYDVVEIFISRNQFTPYLELQLSPKEQPFALLINIPRKETAFPQNLNTESEKITNNPWVSKFKIPLSDIPGSGNILYGNCFSCLGSGKTRSYYALNINSEDGPDFHRPDLFIEFGKILGDVSER